MARVAHVITGLGTGGAELMLARLLPQLEKAGMPTLVVSLKGQGELADLIRRQGTPVISLELERPKRWIPNSASLGRALRSFRPTVVQTWMYHADLLGGLAARFALRCPVVWNLRTTTPAVLAGRQGLVRACARLSRYLPERIVCCSHSAVQAHTEFGYDASKMTVIHNGFDLTQLWPDREAGHSLRRELGIAEGARVIGLVARFDPLKDHENFVLAARRLIDLEPRAVFVLCGDGIDRHNGRLWGWVEREGLASRFHLLGRRTDLRRVNSAFDVASCSSHAEGMPNVVGEAMACGVPCVTTDVGDSALLVGDTGCVVPPRDPEALAQGWASLLAHGEAELRAQGERARARIAERFSIDLAAEAYVALYSKLSSEAIGANPSGSSGPM
ncbi:MAG: glycosyltransferase [Myxococcota bacterium]